MKYKLILAAGFLVLASVSITQSVYAQTSQIATTVSLAYLNVQLAYPSEVLPGQAATVNVQASAKDSLRLNKLVVQVYYGDGNNLHLLTSVTVANNTSVNKGDQISRDIQFNVPAEAPRTSLVALVSENVKMPYYTYASFYYPYSYWYLPSGNPQNPYFFYVYPPNNISATDDALASLSYVKATTPEYVTLQNEYQMLQQQLAQSQSENQKLQQNLQETQARNNSIISDLNQQLAATRTLAQTLEATSIILAAVAIALGLMLFRARTKSEKKSSRE